MLDTISNATAQYDPVAQHSAGESTSEMEIQPSWLDVITTDADDAASIQRRWMPIEYDQIDGGTFAGRFQQLGLQNTLIAAERQNRTVLKRQYFPADFCTVSLIRSVAEPGRCGLDPLSERSIGYMPGNMDYEILLPPSEIVFFRISQERFLQAVSTMGYDLPGDGRQMLFQDGLNPSYLDDMAETLMSMQHSPASNQFAELNHEYLENILLGRVLGSMLDSAARPTRMPPLSAYRITRSARDLVENSAEEPLTVMNLCHELGVSRASLQRCFLQIYGISPLVYLRIRRLNGARRALKAAQGSSVTVTAIALRWGFFHLARFSQDYFHQFGEFPSITLGKSRMRGPSNPMSNAGPVEPNVE